MAPDEPVLDRLRTARPGSRLVSEDGRPRVGLAQRLMELVMRLLITALTRRDYRGMHNIPATGPLVIASNHVSDIDPFVLGDYLSRCGRHPHFMAKKVLFDVPLFGRFLRSARQIAVHRGTLAAGRAMTEAARAANAGAAVVIYPEGMETLDPSDWPMQGKPGAAAVALATGASVVPMAVWGTQEVRGHRHVFRLFPRSRILVVAGEPVEMTGSTAASERARLTAATDKIMSAVLDLERRCRAEPPPPAVVSGRPGWAPDVARRRLTQWQRRRTQAADSDRSTSTN